MEKNLVVVYESEIGTPFVLKPVGNQVLMLRPGTELTRLRVESVNWNNLDKPKVFNGESKFSYLGMTGEQVSARTLFWLLIRFMTFGFYDEDAAKEIKNDLKSMDITCPYEPITIGIHLYEKKNNDSTEYHYSCEGFDNYLCSKTSYLGEDLGISLKMIMETDFFPEIHVNIEQGGFSDELFDVFKRTLMNEVGENANIWLKFIKKEV